MAERATDEWRRNISNASYERWARDRAEKAEAIKADIASGRLASRVDRLVEEGDSRISHVFRILVED